MLLLPCLLSFVFISLFVIILINVPFPSIFYNRVVKHVNTSSEIADKCGSHRHSFLYGIHILNYILMFERELVRLSLLNHKIDKICCVFDFGCCVLYVVDCRLYRLALSFYLLSCFFLHFCFLQFVRFNAFLLLYWH